MRAVAWRMWTIAAVLLIGLAAPQGPAHAHAFDIVAAHVRVQGATATTNLLFDAAKYADVDADGDGQVSQQELDARVENLLARMRAALVLRGPAAPVRVTLTGYEVVGDGHVVRLTQRAEFAEPVSDLAVTARMSALMGAPIPLIVTVEGQGPTRQAVLRADGESAGFTLGRPAAETFVQMLRLGVEHILTGYDHLAFLICLLLGAQTLRRLAWTVTAFTLAHSITLSAAALDAVRLPGALVEAAIAATIIYVAVENLIGARLVKRPWITAAFGLIHGFGFAGALQEIGLQKGQVAVSLLAFNLGVEIGQLAFLAAAWLLLRSALASPRLRTAVSTAVICVAVVWLVQRAALVA